MTTQKIDVLAVMAKLCSFGGAIEPNFNGPRSTRTIRSHLRPATSAQVRAALRKAEKAGDVECVPDPSAGWNRSAADRAEHYWKITPAALARIGGAE